MKELSEHYKKLSKIAKIMQECMEFNNISPQDAFLGAQFFLVAILVQSDCTYKKYCELMDCFKKIYKPIFEANSVDKTNGHE